jgi:hypothetical protein
MAAVTAALFVPAPEALPGAFAGGCKTSLSAPTAWISFPVRVIQIIMMTRNPKTTPMPSKVRILLCPSISTIVIKPPIYTFIIAKKRVLRQGVAKYMQNDIYTSSARKENKIFPRRDAKPSFTCL